VDIARINSETSSDRPSPFFIAQSRLVKCQPIPYLDEKQMFHDLFQALDDYDMFQRKIRKKSSAPIMEFRQRLRLVIKDYFPEHYSIYYTD